MVKTLLVLLCLLAMTGCGSDPPLPAGSEAKPPDASGSAVRSTAPQVVIRPERLPSTGPALAIISGCAGGGDYLWSVNGAPVAGVVGNRLGAEHFRRGDEVTVEARCGGAAARATTSVANSPPEVVAVRFQDPVVVPGRPVVAVPEAVDRDDDLVDYAYQWFVDGVEVEVTDAALPGSFVKRDRQFYVRVTPTDGIDPGPPYNGLPFTVSGVPPRFVSQPPQSFQTRDYRYQARAVDPDGEQIAYRLEEGPAGMAVDAASGMVSWAITPATLGNFRVKIVATDVSGLSAVQEYSFELRPGE